MTVDADVRSHLIAQAVGTSADVFYGPPRPPSSVVPHKAIFCLATGGLPPQGFMDSTSTPWRRSTVQVRIRANVGQYADGQAFALSAWGALQFAEIAGYVRVSCRESQPVYIGQDDTEHDEWAINVELWHGG